MRPDQANEARPGFRACRIKFVAKTTNVVKWDNKRGKIKVFFRPLIKF